MPNATWKQSLCDEGISLLPAYAGAIPPESAFSSENIHALQAGGPCCGLSSVEIRNRLYVTRTKIISGSDYGFVEILNPHLLPRSNPLWIDILDVYAYNSSIGLNASPSYISYYVYDGINLPRRLHHDTSYNSFKIFIAITDIVNLCQGPYVYVKKSHIRKRYMLSDLLSRLDILKTGGDSYDAAWIDWDNLFYGYIPRSHCFISNQKGIHGDLPAHSSMKKVFLVICFNNNKLL